MNLDDKSYLALLEGAEQNERAKMLAAGRDYAWFRHLATETDRVLSGFALTREEVVRRINFAKAHFESSKDRWAYLSGQLGVARQRAREGAGNVSV